MCFQQGIISHAKSKQLNKRMKNQKQTNRKNQFNRQSEHQNPDSGIAEILELSDWGFKIVTISMLN